MQTIYKYPLKVADIQTIKMPADARLLSVGDQGGVLTLWARVDTEAELVPTTFAIYGTGNPIETPESDEVYIGTTQMGPFVWHVFWVFPDDVLS